MRFFHAAIFLCVGQSAATYTFDHGVSDLQSLTSNIRSVRDKIDTYNGGLLQSVDLATAIYSAHSQATAMRKSIGALDNFTIADGEKGVPHFQDAIDTMAEALEAGTAKMPSITREVFAYIAQGMVLQMYQEKSRFQSLMEEKMPGEHYQKCGQHLDKLEAQYKNYLKAMDE